MTDADFYSEANATFGDRLTAAREAAGLSQKELARSIAVDTSRLRRWEDDLTEPRANRLQMLSGVLGVSLRWLLTGEGEGLSEPIEGDGTVAGILSEIRRRHAEITHASEQIGVLEKRLREALKG